MDSDSEEGEEGEEADTVLINDNITPESPQITTRSGRIVKKNK